MKSPQIPALASALLAVLALGACTPAAMRLDPSFARQHPAMTVEGRQGWQIGQTLRYGAYRTGEVRRGWTVSYRIPFVLRFQGSGERFAFEQYDAADRRADVFLVGRLADHELPLLDDFFALSVVDEEALSGSIVTETGVWDLLVYRPGGDIRGGRAEGFVRGGGSVVTIHEVTEFADSPLPSDTPLGYEFRIGDSVVGAVEVIDDGRVWLDESLDPERRLVLAAVASALLLRSDLAAAIEAL